MPNYIPIYKIIKGKEGCTNHLYPKTGGFFHSEPGTQEEGFLRLPASQQDDIHRLIPGGGSES